MSRTVAELLSLLVYEWDASDQPGHSAQGVSMTQSPTIGRTVLFVLPTTSKRAGEIRPAIVVRVNSTDPEYGSVNLRIQLDGPNDAGEPDWQGSVKQDQTGKTLGTWHWMPVQTQGGGFDARIAALEHKHIELHGAVTELAKPVDEAQPSIFASRHGLPQQANAPEQVRMPDAAQPIARAVLELNAALEEKLRNMATYVAELDELCLATGNENSFASRLLRLEEQLRALNEKQPKRQQVEIAHINVGPDAPASETGPGGMANPHAGEGIPAAPIPADSDPNGAH